MCSNVFIDVIALCWVYAYLLCQVQHVINKVSRFKVMLQRADDVSLINMFALEASCPFLASSVGSEKKKHLKNKHTCSLCFLVIFLLPFVAFLFFSYLSCFFFLKEGKQKWNEEAQIKNLLICLFLGFSSLQSHQVVRICLRCFQFDLKHGHQLGEQINHMLLQAVTETNEIWKWFDLWQLFIHRVVDSDFKRRGPEFIILTINFQI